jgi:thioredoxin-related protein
MMETVTFPQDNVQEFIKKYFVSLKYESGRDAEQFLRFGIRATPAYIILDLKGNEITRLTGFQSADDFIKHLEQAHTGAAGN